MASSQLAPVYDYLLSFLVQKATPQEILSFSIPQSERERILELLEKQDADALTTEETSELEQMRQVDLLVSALKAKALASQK